MDDKTENQTLNDYNLQCPHIQSIHGHMKTNRKASMKLRPGTPQHDTALAFVLLVALTDDCSMTGKRRRSELAEHIHKGDLSHNDVVTAA